MGHKPGNPDALRTSTTKNNGESRFAAYTLLLRYGLEHAMDVYWPNFIVGVGLLFAGIPIAMELSRRTSAIYAGTFGIWLLLGVILFSLARFYIKKTTVPSAPIAQPTLGGKHSNGTVTNLATTQAASPATAPPQVTVEVGANNTIEAKKGSTVTAGTETVQPLPSDIAGPAVIRIGSGNQVRAEENSNVSIGIHAPARGSKTHNP